ncbi:MAG: biotin/lipoyl-containing protein [Brevefilum sp.]
MDKSKKFIVEIDGQTYQVEVGDLQARPVVAKVDGELFKVWPENAQEAVRPDQKAPEISVPESAPAPAAPVLSGGGASGKELTAPLPGVIVAVLVKPGDAVSRGQELLTLEAMKMKNAIKSHKEGIINSVEVSVGDLVAHGQTLVTFEE